MELGWNFRYQKAGADPLQIRQGDKDPQKLDDNATLKASVILRFDALDTLVADQAPVPMIVQPLVYSLANFDLEIEGWNEISDSGLEVSDGQRPWATGTDQVTAWRW